MSKLQFPLQFPLQFKVLYRQFLFRMVDLELLSPSAHGDIHGLLARFASLLVIVDVYLALGVLLSSGAASSGGGLLVVWAEEHFLIATTMLVVGLFAVVSWDSMFPDRRDVLVLAPLPVRAATLLSAKITGVAAALGLSIFLLNALTGLAAPLAFGTVPRLRNLVDAAAMLAGLQPSHTVNPALGILRLFGAYWITMLAAGAFTFCSVVSIQGIAQLLPRQKFLRVSAVLQIVAFMLFVGVYFFQLPFASPQELASARNQRLVPWLPSYWFFAMLQQLNGSSLFSSGPKQVTQFAHRAWIGLAASMAGAAASYVICYFRTLRKIAEQPDILPSRAGLHWLPRFGGALETAVVQFSIRSLIRSRRHRVTLAFYLGIAFAIVLFIAKAPELQRQTGVDLWHQPSLPMLVATILVMGSAVVGIRVGFTMPLDLRANWVFRVTPLRGGVDQLKATRRALYALSVLPVWLVSSAVLLSLWPIKQAAWHLAVLGLLGVSFAEICLFSFRKIPFTCSYLPGKSQFHMAVIAYVGIGLLIGRGAEFEQQALTGDDRSLLVTLVTLAVAACVLRWCASWLAQTGNTIEFDERPEPAIMVLGLTRDGTSPV